MLVVDQSLPIPKSLAAVLAFVRKDAGVKRHVRLETAGPQERLAALVARERFLTRMNATVIPQRAPIGELFSARRTHERLLASVDFLVTLAAGDEYERLSALVALKPTVVDRMTAFDHLIGHVQLLRRVGHLVENDLGLRVDAAASYIAVVNSRFDPSVH